MLATVSSSYSFDESASEGVAEVNQLLQQLQADLDNADAKPQQQVEALARVKVLGRDVNTAGPIFTKRGILILSRHAFDQHNLQASHEALRTLANAFLLNEPSRQIFVDLGYTPHAVRRHHIDNRDDEFLISRILFLLTYNTKLDFNVLVNEHDLAGSINQHIAGHSKTFSKSGRRKSASSPMYDMSMIETLKLVFNVTYYCPGLVACFTPAIEPLINILLHCSLPKPPLQPPITFVLNALLNLDLKAAEKKTPAGRESRSTPLFPYSDPEQVIDRLVSILFNAIKTQPEKDLDQAAAPLCTLLRRFYELATPQVQSRMRWLLLPTDKEREQPLGQGQTLASRLLRMSCSPALPTLRDNISSLLFELSDKDANKFIQNIGYGFASGFLTSNNIAIPADSAGSSAASQAGRSDSGQEFNPITGQHLSAEKKSADKQPPMSEAEKELEAERLFVLFERLKATGVVDVKNPVQQAVEEGRFEELD